MADLLEDVVAAVDRLVAAEPSALADGETLVVLHAQVERLHAALTRAVGVFDAGGEWAVDGARSAAAWLSARCRTSTRTAQRRVRCARDLPKMPAAEQAWVGGRIGEAQMSLLRAALATARDAFERDEPMLVEQAATLQLRELDQVVAYWRQLAAPDQIEDEASGDYEARRAHLSPGLRGTGFLDAMFDPLGYAAFEHALRTIEHELFERDWAETRARLGDGFSVDDLPRTRRQRRHDALVEIARRAMAAPPGARLPDPLFTVHLGTDSSRRLCQLANGTVVTPGSLVRWLDDAWIERFAERLPDREVNLSVRRRLFTGGTRRVVEVRHDECYHDYCDVPIEQCQIDHIEPYSAGGLTIDTNGRPACAFHNRLRNRETAGDGAAVHPAEPDEPEQPP